MEDSSVPAFAAEAGAWAANWERNEAWRLPNESEIQTAWAVTEAIAGGTVAAGQADLPWQDLQVREAAARQQQKVIHCNMLRCLCGNPFRPLPAIDPAWLTWGDGTVRKIAQGIYDERAFDRMPILADALEDSGCT